MAVACDQLPPLLAPPPTQAAGFALHCAPAPLDVPPDEEAEGLLAHTLRTTRGPGFGFGGASDILGRTRELEREGTRFGGEGHFQRTTL